MKYLAWLWRSLSPVMGVAALLLFWELVSRATGSTAVFPPPTAALAAIVREASLFAPHAAITLSEALAGLALALAAAFFGASVIAFSRRADSTLMPLVLASQTVPLVAIAPLLTSVIGDGFGAAVLLTAWLCWFPAMISFSHGLLRVHPDRLAVFRAAGATRWQTFAYLRFPGAAAAIAAGVRASAGFALIGAIVVEYGSAEMGLGALIIQHVSGARVLEPDALLGLVVLCAALGLAVTGGGHRLARLALRQYLVADA